MAFVGIFLVFYLIFSLISLAIFISFFILGAVGSCTIAKKRGYDKAYLAFIPVANGYLLGAIADNINQCYNKKTNFRIWLTIGNGISFLAYVFSFISAFSLFTSQDSYLYPSSGIIITIFSILASVGMTACMVIRFIILYKIFVDYSPKNAVLFLILSIFLGLYPIFLFVIRKNPSYSTYYSYQAKYGNQQQQYYQSQGQGQNQNQSNYYQQQPQQPEQYYQQPINHNNNNSTPNQQ